MPFIFCLFIFLSLGFNVSAQSVEIFPVTDINVLQQQFPDEALIITKSIEEYTFERKKTKTEGWKVVVQKSEKTLYTALKGNAEGYNYVAYNDHLNVTYFGNRLRQANGKFTVSGRIQIYDQEILANGTFEGDERVKIVPINLNKTGEELLVESDVVIDDIRYFPGVFFQENTGVAKKVVRLKIPKWLKLDMHWFNKDTNLIDLKLELQQDSMQEYTYTVNNVNKFIREENGPSFLKSAPHIVLLPKSFLLENNTSVPIFNTVQNLYEYDKMLLDKVKNDTLPIRVALKNLIENKNTDIEKVESIFYYVQDNISYLGFQKGIAGFVPQAAQVVYANKFGDCKGMANLLATFLQMAGFDAQVAWIGTDDLPYNYSTPFLGIANHMICVLNLNNKKYFLDATQKYVALEDYATRIQGKEVLIPMGNTYYLEKVPVMPFNRNQKLINNYFKIKGNNLKVSLQTLWNGDDKLAILNHLYDAKNIELEKKIKNILKLSCDALVVDSIQVQEYVERKQPLQFKYQATLRNAVLQVGNELYVNLDYDKTLENYMPEKKRKTPIVFSETENIIFTSNLEIPLGYAVSFLPKPLLIDEALYSISVTYTNENKLIVLTKKIIAKKGVIALQEMDKFRNQIQQLKSINAQQVVLKKI